MATRSDVPVSNDRTAEARPNAATGGAPDTQAHRRRAGMRGTLIALLAAVAAVALVAQLLQFFIVQLTPPLDPLARMIVNGLLVVGLVVPTVYFVAYRPFQSYLSALGNVQPKTIARLESLMQSTKDAVIAADSAGHIVLWNEGAREMFGYDEEEALGQPLTMLMPTHYRERHERGLQRVRSTGRSGLAGVPLRFHGLRRDGTEFPVELCLSSWHTSEGRFFGGIVRDMSRGAELEQAHDRLATAIAQAAEAVVITDADGTIQYVNPAFEKITGYSADEAIGKNPRILKSGAHDSEFYERMWDTLRRGDVWSARFVNKRKDGTLYEEDQTIAPVTDDSGRIINYVSVKRDVTHEVQAEKQLEQAQRLESIGRLAGGIAHDFNNLLMAIMGSAEIVLSGLGSDHRHREDVEEIAKAGRRAATLTRQLLAFSRKQVLNPQIVDLNMVIQELEGLLRRLIGAEITLKTALEPELGRVRADPAQLEQVIMNLAVNARDAMPRGGTLTIETDNVQLDARYAARHVDAEPGPYVMVAVSDTGIGMDNEVRANIFEPFYTTKELGKGTGLGLATVYGIVRQSGGHIGVYSEPGEGSTFKVYLPRAAGSPRNVKPRTPIPKSVKGSETILVAEDSYEVRRVVRRVLEGHGYTVLVASNGEEAERVVQDHPDEIHLIITDVIMPDIRGPELVEWVRSERPQIKVLFVSGFTDKAALEYGLLQSGFRFLQKPITPASLLRAVRDVLGRQEGS